jgi:hypothetical protein
MAPAAFGQFIQNRLDLYVPITSPHPVELYCAQRDLVSGSVILSSPHAD